MKALTRSVLGCVAIGMALSQVGCVTSVSIRKPCATQNCQPSYSPPVGLPAGVPPIESPTTEPLPPQPYIPPAPTPSSSGSRPLGNRTAMMFHSMGEKFKGAFDRH